MANMIYVDNRKVFQAIKKVSLVKAGHFRLDLTFLFNIQQVCLLDYIQDDEVHVRRNYIIYLSKKY